MKFKLMLVLDESSPAQWVVVVRSAVFLLNKVRCVGLGSVVSCLRGTPVSVHTHITGMTQVLVSTYDQEFTNIQKYLGATVKL